MNVNKQADPEVITIMRQTDEALELAKDNQGIITAEMADRAGISRGILKHLVEKGALNHPSRGLYSLPEAWEDEFVALQNRYKRGIFSLETALYLLDLTDRTPVRFHMTFPLTYNLTGPKQEGVACNSAIDSVYGMGVVALKTPSGNLVRAYNAERTLCDILKTRNRMDIQIVSDAFRRYFRGNGINIPLLSEYARRLRVAERLQAYLEVLE